MSQEQPRDPPKSSEHQGRRLRSDPKREQAQMDSWATVFYVGTSIGELWKKERYDAQKNIIKFSEF